MARLTGPKAAHFRVAVRKIASRSARRLSAIFTLGRNSGRIGSVCECSRFPQRLDQPQYPADRIRRSATKKNQFSDNSALAESKRIKLVAQPTGTKSDSGQTVPAGALNSGHVTDNLRPPITTIFVAGMNGMNEPSSNQSLTSPTGGT
jgi:hypothetical protein